MVDSIAFVQARMGSSRYPGKMLVQLGGQPIIEWVLRRCKSSRLLSKVVLITSDLAIDDVLVSIAKNHGVPVFRGDEIDVLGRFASAAQIYNAKNIVRICADNPFVDPEQIDKLIKYFESGSYDYICNHQNRLGSRYADGFGAEIFSSAILEEMASKALTSEQREHVTLYLWENASRYKIHSLPAPPSLAFPELRFDVDLPSDLRRLERLLGLGVTLESTASEIINISQNLS